jgi:hypothetical protein
MQRYGILVMMLFGKKIDGIISFGILNLDHWNLFEIWLLVLGIFLIFTMQIILVETEGVRI